MPWISIVLPAYRVQAYLRACLDSILGQSFTDIEVIAVDDCSPDGCGDIMDEYARADERVRVLHLEENVGLGEARNIGLDHASGEYVWFVDSDDYLADGALQAISDRLQETKADVLFFDYARVYWTGDAQRNVLNHLFREPPAPDTFSLQERPSVLQLMMTAWNKAIRREFLLGLGVRFSRGYYEDVPVTYPILMAAERISLLDRVCYYYRQRLGGAITRTTNDRHLDAFGQYEKIFAFMDQQGEHVDQLRAMMFGRTMWHYLIILGRGDRVSHHARREFFRRMSRHYRMFCPPDFVPPGGGLLRLKYWLVKQDAYRVFSVFRVFNKTQQTAKKRLVAAYRSSRRVLGLAKRRAFHLYYRLQLKLPVDERLAVYAAYWYRGYACNPAAIYEKMRELAPSVRGVWVVQPHMIDTIPPGVDYVLANTSRYYRTLARAKYLVNNVNFPNEIGKHKHAVYVQTHHGTPVKVMGLDQQPYPAGARGMAFPFLLQRSDLWDFSITSNRFSTEQWERAYPCQYESLEVGYPRNDRLCAAGAEDVAKARAKLGLGPGQTVVLYAPTFREYQPGFQPLVDLAALSKALGSDSVLLVRAHYFNLDKKDPQQLQADGHVVDVSAHGSVEDLCLAADVLVTDYSSIVFDFANLDRPIVVYAPDWDAYRLVRGVYFNLLEEPPGAVATSQEELLDVFRSKAAWGEEANRKRAEFRRKFCQFDDGHAAERVVRRVFLDQPLT